MSSDQTATRREDESQLRDLAYRYARMMDRREFDWLPEVFAEIIDATRAGGGVINCGPPHKMTRVEGNRIKAEQFDLDEDAVMEYFVLDKVLEDGVFYMAEKLYGLTFQKRTDLPVYHPTVTTYDVMDADGSQLGIFYFDPFQRPSKRGGAWMSNFVEQSHLYGTKPVIYNVLNIPKAPEGEPCTF